MIIVEVIYVVVAVHGDDVDNDDGDDVGDDIGNAGVLRK